MQTLISDLRWGLRLLLKNPGFTLAALLSLSIGIGVTTLVFTFASSAFLRTIPVQDPDRLVYVHGGRPTYAQYLALRDQSGPHLDLVACLGGSGKFTTGDFSGAVRFLTVSDNYFQAVGVKPAAGRFPIADPALSAPNSCVISHGFWTDRFGASQEVIGKTIRLGNTEVTVTGVGPGNFRGLDLVPVDIWLPAPAAHRKSEKAQWQLFGRLAPGASVVQARTILEQGYAALGPGASENEAKFRLSVQSLTERQRLLYAPVTFFTGLGLLVLLVGCANVTGLLSTRSIERRTEIAVRMALGCARSRLVRLVLTESALLAGIAAVLALGVTWALIRLAKPWLPHELLGVSFENVNVDSRVLAATLGFACLATLVAGLLPAWGASRTDLITAMKGNAFGTALSTRASLRKTLVVLQLAVSFAFVCIGGLFVRSMSVDSNPDLPVDRLALVNLFGITEAEKGPEPRVVHQTVLTALAGVPGVEQVTIASAPPSAAYQRTAVRMAEDDSGTVAGQALLVAALPNYFETTGTAIIRGRIFSDPSGAGAGGEIVISAAMARRFWPGEEPLGRSVILGNSRTPPCLVVGVVKDVRTSNPALYDRPPDSVVYVSPYSLADSGGASYYAVVKTHGPAVAFLPEIRNGVDKLSLSTHPSDCQTLESSLTHFHTSQQFGALFALILGLLAGTLAAFGLYSVISSTVVARTREIGIRAALGATAGQTAGLFLRQGVRLSILGIVLGLPIALGAARALRSGMFGIVPVDVRTMLVSAVAVALATMVASYLPARRAARVHPSTALRIE